jgi:hypothetical protein
MEAYEVTQIKHKLNKVAPIFKDYTKILKHILIIEIIYVLHQVLKLLGSRATPPPTKIDHCP